MSNMKALQSPALILRGCLGFKKKKNYQYRNAGWSWGLKACRSLRTDIRQISSHKNSATKNIVQTRRRTVFFSQAITYDYLPKMSGPSTALVTPVRIYPTI